MTQTILIVEDDPDGQVLVSHVVHYLNIQCNVVANAEDAIEKLFIPDQSYRAVIIDLHLPGKDGWELLTDIRNMPRHADVLCIAVTAFHSSKTREEAIRAGFDAYFSKPLDAAHFARELESILGENV